MKNIMSLLKHMKKLVLIPFLILVLFISSCKDIIDLKPYNSMAEETAFSNASLVGLAVTGMYQAAQRGYYNGSDARGYPFGAAFITQGDARGEDVVNNATFYQATYTATYDRSSTLNNVSVVITTNGNVTDSYLGVPTSIFTDRAADLTTGGGQ